MGLPVVTVASGGLPIVETTSGTPVTEATNLRGVPVTKVVGKPGLPVTFETIGVAPPTLVAFDLATVSFVTLSNGNLTATQSGQSTVAGARVAPASLKSTGKFYFEGTMGGVLAAFNCFGILNSTGIYNDMINGGTNCLAAYQASGNIYSNNVFTSKTIGVLAAGNVIGIAVDLAARLGWIRKGAGNWNGDPAANPATGVGGVTVGTGNFGPAAGFNNVSTTGAFWAANFGATAFANAAPAGFGNWTA